MNVPARALVFAAAMLLGVFVMLDHYHGPFIAGYFGSLHFQTQDVLLWAFGSLFVLGAVYSFLRRPGVSAWRSGVLLVLGAAMIYGELGDVPWLKELTCHVIYRHHYVWDGPCYQTN
jgi:hypothetical protein